MTLSNEHRPQGGFIYHIAPEATAHDLMNEATVWLQYARGLTSFMSELVHEADVIDCRKMALSLDAIEALMSMGVQCTAQAHVRMCWEQAKAGDAGSP